MNPTIHIETGCLDNAGAIARQFVGGALAAIVSDDTVFSRYGSRLEASLKEGVKLGGELIAFIHYPPIYRAEENVYLTDVLQRYGVKRCYYAHLHGSSIKGSINGIRNGIDYRLVSADGVGFDPVLIERR